MVKEQLLNERRIFAAGITKPFFRYEFHDPQENLHSFNRFLQMGHAVVLTVPHFSSGDFQRVLEVMLLQSPQVRKHPIILPTAWHQIKSPGLEQIMALGNVELMPVVTEDTKAKEQQYEQLGREIPWEIHESGFGLKEYITRATNVIDTNQGGLILFAPQGGRRPELAPFEGRPIEMLDRLSKRRGSNKNQQVAYCSVGLSIPGVTDYSKKRGMNLFTEYQVQLGRPFTREELHYRAAQNGWSIDEEMRNDMMRIAPIEYIPEEERELI